MEQTTIRVFGHDLPQPSELKSKPLLPHPKGLGPVANKEWVAHQDDIKDIAILSGRLNHDRKQRLDDNRQDQLAGILSDNYKILNLSDTAEKFIKEWENPPENTVDYTALNQYAMENIKQNYRFFEVTAIFSFFKKEQPKTIYFALDINDEDFEYQKECIDIKYPGNKEVVEYPSDHAIVSFASLLLSNELEKMRDKDPSLLSKFSYKIKKIKQKYIIFARRFGEREAFRIDAADNLAQAEEKISQHLFHSDVVLIEYNNWKTERQAKEEAEILKKERLKKEQEERIRQKQEELKLQKEAIATAKEKDKLLLDAAKQQAIKDTYIPKKEENVSVTVETDKLNALREILSEKEYAFLCSHLYSRSNNPVYLDAIKQQAKRLNNLYFAYAFYSDVETKADKVLEEYIQFNDLNKKSKVVGEEKLYRRKIRFIYDVSVDSYEEAHERLEERVKNHEGTTNFHTRIPIENIFIGSHTLGSGERVWLYTDKVYNNDVAMSPFSEKVGEIDPRNLFYIDTYRPQYNGPILSKRLKLTEKLVFDELAAITDENSVEYSDLQKSISQLLKWHDVNRLDDMRNDTPILPSIGHDKILVDRIISMVKKDLEKSHPNMEHVTETKINLPDWKKIGEDILTRTTK